MIARVRLSAVGDVMLGDSAICTGYGFASRYSDPEFMESMSSVASLFRSADIVFGNLECSLSRSGHAPRKWSTTQLRGRPEFARGLRAAGFDVMNVANNHAAQHGDEAFAETVALMRAAGVECCGVRGDDPWCSEPVILEANGLHLGFLGYCLRPRQYSPATPPYAEGTVAEITADVGRLSTAVDHVIVSLHWGEEYVPTPSQDEVQMAHEIIEAGTAVILGHHPHVPRPVERYGPGVIAYSLSNFISDMIWYSPLRSPLLLTLELAEEPENEEVTRLRIADDYLPVNDDSPDPFPISLDVRGLSETAYQRDVHRTIREGRIASYRHALRNVHRFRSPTLLQLLWTTVRNKLAGLRYLRAKQSG